MEEEQHENEGVTREVDHRREKYPPKWAATLPRRRHDYESRTLPHKMRKLLMICQTLPYPPDGGSKIRTYNVISQLAKAFDVELLAFVRKKKGFEKQDVEAAVDGLRPVARTETFAIPQQASWGRWCRDHALSVVTRRVYTARTFASATLLERMKELMDTESFSAVHLDSLDLAVYRPELGDVPVTCTHHDAQSVLLRRRAESQGRWVVRKYMELQADLMEKEEERWCPRMDCNFTVSDVDKKILTDRAPTARFEVIPNGVDIDYFRPTEGPMDGIVFVGGTSWYPNRDALSYYVQEIRPELDRLGVRATTTWVGRALSDELERYGPKERIRMTGYVPDIRPFVTNAACYVVPLRVGGGTRVKILDAWAMGKAIVSTSIGAEGLNALDGDNILLRDDPVDFAEAVREVLGDSDLRERLSRNARKTAVEEYSWDRIGSRLRNIYQEILRD